MGDIDTPGRNAGIRLRWHLRGHHPLEVDALFHRRGLSLVLRIVFRATSSARQPCPVAFSSFYPKTEFSSLLSLIRKNYSELIQQINMLLLLTVSQVMWRFLRL